VGEIVSTVYQKSRHSAQFFMEQVAVADTPCQSPHAGGLSATGVQAAVSVTHEMDREHRSVIRTRPLGKRSRDSYELELSSALTLGVAARVAGFFSRRRSFFSRSRVFFPRSRGAAAAECGERTKSNGDKHDNQLQFVHLFLVSDSILETA